MERVIGKYFVAWLLGVPHSLQVILHLMFQDPLPNAG